MDEVINLVQGDQFKNLTNSLDIMLQRAKVMTGGDKDQLRSIQAASHFLNATKNFISDENTLKMGIDTMQKM